MNWRNYEEQVIQGMHIAPGTQALAHAALGLAGEAGEVADLVKKSQYAQPKVIDPADMKHELGDALWYLTYLARYYGYTLDEIARANIIKLAARHPGGRYDPETL